MASAAAHRPDHHEPRLFGGPTLFRRRRKAVSELVGLLWLAVQIARLARSAARRRATAET